MSQDDDKLRKLIQTSPKLTPPESFYQGVLREIERKKESTTTPARGLWGWPVKTFATACVLMVLVLATREKQKISPDLRSVVMEDRLSRMAEPRPPSAVSYRPKEKRLNGKGSALASAPAKETDSHYYWQGTQLYNAGRLGESFESFEKAIQSKQNSKEAEAYLLQIRQEIVSNAKKRSDERTSLNYGERQSPESAVQEHLAKGIGGYVATPSPFEEEDAKLRARIGDKKREAMLDQKTADSPAAANASLPQSRDEEARKNDSAPKPWRLQARDTVNGVATQDSFDKDQIENQWKGASSGIVTSRTVVIQTKEAWDALWQEHMSKSFASSPAPVIDFDHFMVAGIFAGAKPTAGYAVEILDVKNLPDQIVVTYRETHPPAGMMTAQVITQPYHLRLIPKTALPITFKKLP